MRVQLVGWSGSSRPARLRREFAVAAWMDGHDAMRLWGVLIETSERQEGRCVESWTLRAHQMENGIPCATVMCDVHGGAVDTADT